MVFLLAIVTLVWFIAGYILAATSIYKMDVPMDG
jgi:hypothetical protein